MTKLLDRAIEAAKELPAEMQDEIARVMLTLVGKGEPVHQLTAEEEASFAKSLEQAARRQFAPAEQVQAIWSKYTG
ncbi:hypothetical protein ABCW43_01710 [Neorhizobium sp. IRAMC:178]|uniref:hypothetical protein n=1 Tax=Neorhizobium tunisiense TaxID=3144793 RepID=UPI0031F63B5D